MTISKVWILSLALSLSAVTARGANQEVVDAPDDYARIDVYCQTEHGPQESVDQCIERKKAILAKGSETTICSHPAVDQGLFSGSGDSCAKFQQQFSKLYMESDAACHDAFSDQPLSSGPCAPGMCLRCGGGPDGKSSVCQASQGVSVVITQMQLPSVKDAMTGVFKGFKDFKDALSNSSQMQSCIRSSGDPNLVVDQIIQNRIRQMKYAYARLYWKNQGQQQNGTAGVAVCVDPTQGPAPALAPSSPPGTGSAVTVHGGPPGSVPIISEELPPLAKAPANTKPQFVAPAPATVAAHVPDEDLFYDAKGMPLPNGCFCDLSGDLLCKDGTGQQLQPKYHCEAKTKPKNKTVAKKPAPAPEVAVAAAPPVVTGLSFSARLGTELGSRLEFSPSSLMVPIDGKDGNLVPAYEVVMMRKGVASPVGLIPQVAAVPILNSGKTDGYQKSVIGFSLYRAMVQLSDTPVSRQWKATFNAKPQFVVDRKPQTLDDRQPAAVTPTDKIPPAWKDFALPSDSPLWVDGSKIKSGATSLEIYRSLSNEDQLRMSSRCGGVVLDGVCQIFAVKPAGEDETGKPVKKPVGIYTLSKDDKTNGIFWKLQPVQ